MASFWNVWVKRPELYPLYGAIGLGAVLATYSSFRILNTLPDVYVSGRDRRANALDPGSERFQALADKYNAHPVRHWKQNASDTGLFQYQPLKFDVPEYEQKKREAAAKGEDI
eukprot:CAMPEP_0113895274 /NCGR_PEP_ID=MMETSP0780_2-20120614/17257_1 /TAXON_ID=652834 /ORGANISM="Palpitomonas bilix" /LENGTH=112 /DNA_ID=CAMNT_0000886057 /DNA_START=97 /DNA_END=435 /DNA_ORIENTATION=+ /assembly_acc=CAM_ASM_000599